MRIYARLERAVGVLGRAGAWLGVCCCFALMLLIVANVVGRTISRSAGWLGPVPGTIEITEALMVIIAGMLLAYTQAMRGHINVEFLVERLPAGLRKAFSLIVLLLALGVCVILVWQNWGMGLDAWAVKDYSSTPPNVPYYPAKLLLAVGVSLFGLQIFVDVWRDIIKIFSGAGGKSGATA